MKTYTLVYLLSTALFFVSCVKNSDGVQKPEEPKTDISAVESLTDYDIPVKSGMTTVVTVGEDTLAVTKEAMRIAVPKYAQQSGELKVTYTDEEIYTTFGSSQYWQYLSFEDTRNGDYDYNDLVIHCRVKSSKAWGQNEYTHTVSVQPVALGSSTTIKLGMLYQTSETPLSEYIITDNVRQSIFLGNPTFPINTNPNKERKQVSKKLIEYFSIKSIDPQLKVVWFIETPGSGRLYAATTNFGADKIYDMISADGIPYGISLTKKWNYPIEQCSIWKAYPKFYEWAKNGDEATLLKNPVSENTFIASPPPSEGDDLWNYDL